MELIVKIGADQQGLRDTVEKLKSQFKNMNTSAPSSWSGSMAAMDRYGSIMQSRNIDSTFKEFTAGLSKISPAAGALVEKFGSMAGPIGMVGTALAGLALIVKNTGSAIALAASDTRTARITGMSPIMARRMRQATSAAGVDEGAGTMMVNRLNAQVGAFNSGEESAKKLFDELGINPSEMSVDDLLKAVQVKFGEMKDPAKRARMSRGLFGRGGFEAGEVFSKMKAPNIIDEIIEGESLADASALKKWWKKIGRAFEEGKEEAFLHIAAIVGRSRGMRALGVKPERRMESQVSGEEFIEPPKPKDPEKPVKVEIVKNKAEKLSDEQKLESKPMSFQADALAQAGLFAGSSLLFNPTFTIEMEQLQVLRKIEAHAARETGIFR